MIALVHEWLDTYGGSEYVLENLLAEFAEADVYALVDFMNAPERDFLSDRSVRTSFIQKLPFARGHFRAYLPLMPLAVEQFDLSSYDVVISSSHAVAKGAITGPDQLHISYVHSPIRYAWDLQHQYLSARGLERGPRSWLARASLHYLRNWDVRSASGVDVFIANSRFIARRIKKVYRRDAEVVYPPVDVRDFGLCEKKDDYFLTTSRLVPYKRVELIVEAFRLLPDHRLVVVGDGPEMGRIERLAGRNVELLGHQTRESVISLTQRARAFVFAALEDFGIAPVEAQSCGTPVIAYGRGGTLETVIDAGHASRGHATGILYHEQSVPAIVEAIRAFTAVEDQFNPQQIRSNALNYAPEVFRSRFLSALERAKLCLDS